MSTRRYSLPSLCTMTACWLVIGCGASQDIQAPDLLARVEISPTAESVIDVGDSLQYEIVLRDRTGSVLSASGRTIAWRVSPSSLAEIRESGLLIAREVGTGTVEAQVGDQRATATIAIRRAVAKLYLYAPWSLKVGDTSRAIVHLYDADSAWIEPDTRVARWSITPAQVATVDSTGKVTALAHGSAELRVRVDALEATSTITVDTAVAAPPPPPPPPPTSPPPLAPQYGVGIILPKYLLIGDTVSALIRVSVYGMTVYYDSVAAWSSSASAVATVNGVGRVAGVGAGTALISAIHRERSASTDVQVLGPPPAWADFVSLAIAEFNSCGVQRADGSLLCWGEGSPYASERAPMAVVPGENGFVAAIGSRCGIRADGTFRCYSATAWSGPPIQWRRLVLDRETLAHGSCGIGADSTVACWYGADSVVTQAGGAKFIDVDLYRPDLMSEARMCGIRTDSTAVCWTRGNATTTPVPGLSSLVEVRMGTLHACYRDVHAVVWCVGENTSAQLGNGTTLPVTGAYRHAGLPPIASLHIRGVHTCAVAVNGQAWCWGGTQTSPELLQFLEQVKSIGIGPTHRCALKNDGSTWCWGTNSAGQLGDGTRLYRSTPTRVRGSYPP